MKTNAIRIPRTKPIPSIGYLFFVRVARWLSQFTTAENDYSIRAQMGELTRDEAIAEIQADIAVQERNREWGAAQFYIPAQSDPEADEELGG